MSQKILSLVAFVIWSINEAFVNALSCSSTLECPSRSTSGYHVSSNKFDMQRVETAAFGFDRYSVSTSVSFDAEREEFVYTNVYFNDDAMKYDVNTIDANYADPSVTNPGYQTTNLLDSTTVLPTDDGHFPYYVGSEIANDILYAVDYYGRLIAVDLETHDVVNYVDLAVFPNGFATSVCIDSVDMIAYVVDGITAAMYAIDISNDTLGGWEVDTIQSPYSSITDTTGANPHIYAPYDCTVLEGTVFTVDNGFGDIGALGIYDIDAGTFMYDTTVLDFYATSIASSNGILVIGTTSLDAEKIQFFTYDCCNSAQATFENVANITQNGTEPLVQIDINWVDGVIAAATAVDNSRGYLHFIQSDDLIYAPPTTVQPTSFPTASPTEPDVQTTEKVIQKTESVESSAPENLSKNTFFVLLFVAIVYFYVY